MSGWFRMFLCKGNTFPGHADNKGCGDNLSFRAGTMQARGRRLLRRQVRRCDIFANQSGEVFDDLMPAFGIPNRALANRHSPLGDREWQAGVESDALTRKKPMILLLHVPHRG